MEVWLRRPIEGVPPLLMPAAHALLKAAEDVVTARWVHDYPSGV